MGKSGPGEVRVQGLLGITVDGCDVFLVSMDERIGFDSNETCVSAGSFDADVKPAAGLQRIDVCKTKRSGQDQASTSGVSCLYDIRETSFGYGTEQTASYSTDCSFSGRGRQKKIRKKKSSRLLDDKSALVESRAENDDAILIDSDGAEYGTFKQENVAEAHQLAHYYTQNEPPADDVAGYYAAQVQNCRQFKTDTDSGYGHQYMGDTNYDDNTGSCYNAEDYVSDYNAKSETVVCAEASWNAGAAGRMGLAKKQRKPLHFGGRGALSRRRRHAQHNVSSSV
jgi:hypothetical protein